MPSNNQSSRQSSGRRERAAQDVRWRAREAAAKTLSISGNAKRKKKNVDAQIAAVIEENIEELSATTPKEPADEAAADLKLDSTTAEPAAEARGAAEPKRKPTAAEAAAELGLNPVGRDDWVQHFASETDKEKQELLIAATSFEDGNGGTLISQTADQCACCREETTECFPCAGAHKVCRKCRAENQENAIEKCPICRTQFVMAEVIHGRNFDRTFQKVEHPMLKQLLTLQLKGWKAQLEKAEQQAAEDEDELTETQKLLLMAKDVQTQHKHGVAGLSDTVVYNGKTDMSLGETEQLCFCSAGRDMHGSGPFQFTNPGGNKRYSLIQRCETCDVRTRHKVWMEAVRTIKQIEDHCQIQAFWHRCRRQEGADRRRAQRCMDYLRAKSETLEGKRLIRMDFYTRYPDAEPTRYINMADAITEVTFIHMREQTKGVLQIQRDEWTKMSKRDLERARRANGLIYPLEHSVRRRLRICGPLAFALHLPRSRADLEVAGSRLAALQMLRGDRGLPGGAHYNNFGQLDGYGPGCSGRPGHLEPKLNEKARKAGVTHGYVEWDKVREQMVKDLKANNAWWRGYDFTEEDLHDKAGKLTRASTGQKYRAHFWSTVGGDNPIPGSPPKVPNLPAGAEDDLVTLGGGTKRPSALDIWLTPMQYLGIRLYQSEADEILDMFTGKDAPFLFGPDSEMARVAAGFGDGPAIMINTMRKVREFPVEVEGEMKDGRWVNMAIEDPWHPLPANPKDLEARGMTTQHDWPELHHVVSEMKDGTAVWKMIRSEVLTEQPWSKPSQTDTAKGLPALIDLDGENWFGDAFRNGRIQLGEVSMIERPKIENFPHNHPLRDPNHPLAMPFKRAFPPRLNWTGVAIEDRRRRLAELASAELAAPSHRPAQARPARDELPARRRGNRGRGNPFN